MFNLSGLPYTAAIQIAPDLCQIDCQASCLALWYPDWPGDMTKHVYLAVMPALEHWDDQFAHVKLDGDPTEDIYALAGLSDDERRRAAGAPSHSPSCLGKLTLLATPLAHSQI